jgi:hypothetical protein
MISFHKINSREILLTFLFLLFFQIVLFIAPYFKLLTVRKLIQELSKYWSVIKVIEEENISIDLCGSAKVFFSENCRIENCNNFNFEWKNFSIV